LHYFFPLYIDNTVIGVTDERNNIIDHNGIEVALGHDRRINLPRASGQSFFDDNLITIGKAFEKGASKVVKKSATKRKRAKNSAKRWEKKGLIKFSTYCEKDVHKWQKKV